MAEGFFLDSGSLGHSGFRVYVGAFGESGALNHGDDPCY